MAKLPTVLRSTSGSFFFSVAAWERGASGCVGMQLFYDFIDISVISDPTEMVDLSN